MSGRDPDLPENARVLEALSAATCNICGRSGEFSGRSEHLEGLTVPAWYDLREGLVCAGCGSISRDRAIVHVMAGVLDERGPLEGWRPRPAIRLLETSGYRGHPERFDRLFDYFNTRYLPPDDLAATLDGRTTANLEDLPYPGRFFDLMVTAEVLEHVADLERALREIHRVLDDMGIAVITAPYFHDWPRTSTRVERWRDRDVHLYPAEYHAEDTLVYRLFGRDFLTLLAGTGFSVAYVSLADPAWAIARTEVIVASKRPYLDLTPFLANARV